MASVGRRLVTSQASPLAKHLLESIAFPSLSPFYQKKSNSVLSFPLRWLFRYLSSVPDAWGRPTEYTEGTDFLGTPKDHLRVRFLSQQRSHAIAVGREASKSTRCV